MPYKILMATMGLDIGGAETHLVELSKQLKGMGYDVVVVSNGGVYVPEIEAAGIRHYQAPLHRRSLGDMARARSILRRVICRERPDVVHAHARIPAFLAGSLQPALGFPLVTTCHGVYQVSGALKLLSNWGERTLAVAEDVRDYLTREYGIVPEHITLTINGIDTEKFSPQVSGERVRREFGLGQAPVVGHVSRLDQAASLAARQLIEIAPRLDRAVPGVRVLITGGGDVYQELADRAAQVNRELGRECLILTGPRTDVNEIAAACDLFVGVSRAALEAMSAGRPVVLSGAQGHTGLFTPERLEKAIDTNFCCRTDPVATPELLLEEISAALALPPEEKGRLGEYGRQVVQEHYSVRRMAQDCLGVYDQVRRKRHRVLMSGYYGFSNAGDDAILQSIHDNLAAASSEISVTVLSHDPEQTTRRYGLNALPTFHPLKLWRAVGACDVLLSGGGSLLQDRTSTRSLLYYLAVIRMALLRGKKVMLYANGIGPVTRPANRRRVRRAVERADLVTLRDHSSARELREMGVAREDLHVTADPVFTMDWAPEERVDAILEKARLPQGQPFAVVSVREWRGMGEGFPRKLAELCCHLYEKHGLMSVFVLMQPEHDRELSLQVQNSLSIPSLLLEGSFTPPELMGVIARSRLCVAMRLHTLIFAARVAVPLVGLVYDPKVASYLKELDMPSAGDVSAFSAERAKSQVDALMEHYDERRARLAQRSRELTQAARENERLLLELLEKE